MKKEWVEVLKTLLQVAIPLAASMPALIPVLGLSATAGVGAILLAGSAVVTRLMTVPAIHDRVEKLIK